MAVAQSEREEARHKRIATLGESPAMLVMLAGLPVLAAVWMLVSPDVVLSHEMTWDFLYNLSGAWHLMMGHVPHVDFHDPVGDLNILLTRLGFDIVGLHPSALLVGAVVMTAFSFTMAVLVARRRLPLVPATLFVVFASLLALMPANVGDKPEAYSFAMVYNRYGWSLLAILALILFVPPAHDAKGEGLDVIVGGALLVTLYYTKITYFAAGLALVALAVMISAHVRALPPAWAAVGGLVLANALAPWNHPYLFDILRSTQSGITRSSVSFHLNNFFESAEGYAGYAAGLVLALGLWLRGLTSLHLPIAVAGVLGVGLLVLSQNHQVHGLPLGIVVAFMLYDHIRRRLGPDTPFLPVLMVFPLFAISASAYSLAAYHLRAGRMERLEVVDHTQLAGLAVPRAEHDLLSDFANGTADHALLNRARAPRARFDLTPTEYVATLVEAADLLRDRYPPGGIVVIDQVNPLPLMLGWSPPRGGNLWYGWIAPMRPPAELFAEAQYVLIPKFSTLGAWTDHAREVYKPYLERHFRPAQESRSWFLLVRTQSTALGREPQRR